MVNPRLRIFTTFLKWYIASYVGLVVTIVILLLLNDVGVTRMLDLLPRITLVLARHPLT